MPTECCCNPGWEGRLNRRLGSDELSLLCSVGIRGTPAPEPILRFLFVAVESRYGPRILRPYRQRETESVRQRPLLPQRDTEDVLRCDKVQSLPIVWPRP